MEEHLLDHEIKRCDEGFGKLLSSFREQLAMAAPLMINLLGVNSRSKNLEG